MGKKETLTAQEKALLEAFRKDHQAAEQVGVLPTQVVIPETITIDPAHFEIAVLKVMRAYPDLKRVPDVSKHGLGKNGLPKYLAMLKAPAGGGKPNRNVIFHGTGTVTFTNLAAVPLE